MKVFAKLRYVNTLNRKGQSDKASGRKFGSVEGHLKYIGFRSTEIAKDGAGFFGKFNDREDWKQFFKRVKEHPALQYSKSIKVHQGILSLWGKDYQNYVAETGRDFRYITRKVMEQLETRKGMKLDWIAAFHEESKHPHVHFAIKAVGDAPPGQRAQRVKLDKDDLEFIKEAFTREVEPYVLEPQQDHFRFDESMSFDRSMKELSYALQTFNSQLEQLQNRTQREHDFLLRKKSKNKNKDRGR